MITNKQQNWGYWFVLPLYPYRQRPTIREEIIKDTIWTFEQPHGWLYAVVPIRMTVIRLNKGGLLVYCPIAPTAECVKLMRELEDKHGKVKYIIHSTSSGLEHKVFVGPFSRYFPPAEVWSAPSQWSFPVNLPLTWLGFPPKRTKILPRDDRQSPFRDEFKYQILDIDLSAGSFVEVALLHKESKTLLVTDSVIKIPTSPPKIVELNPFPLLFHARESALEKLENTLEIRLKGWHRICLFALYFRPSRIDTTPLKQLFFNALNAPDKSLRNYLGLYPFRWKKNWHISFEAIQERLLVAPILETLILPQAPKQVIQWAGYIMTWDFNKIIPAHFSAPIETTPSEFRQAFSFLERNSLYPSGNEQVYRQDSTFIKQLEAKLIDWGIAKPSKLT